jgi:hypothetical protein
VEVNESHAIDVPLDGQVKHQGNDSLVVLSVQSPFIRVVAQHVLLTFPLLPAHATSGFLS